MKRAEIQDGGVERRFGSAVGETRRGGVGPSGLPIRGGLLSGALRHRLPLSSRPVGPNGFSMVEVLLAIFILGVGLIMVACIFPVGADWTRQNAEETVSGVMAKNAVALIQTKYTLADLQLNATTNYAVGMVAYDPNNAAPGLFRCGTAGVGGGGWTPVPIAPLTAFQSGGPAMGLGTAPLQKLPLVDRAYAFGTSSPYPAANPAGATYFWQAMIRATPGTPRRFDLYVLVMKKGALDQKYGASGFPAANEVPFCRLANDDPNAPGAPYFEPYLAQTGSSTPSVGSQGIGVSSGTVFRQLPASGATSYVPRPSLIGQASLSDATGISENVIYVPPAVGTTVSPLVYIYQTSIGF